MAPVNLPPPNIKPFDGSSQNFKYFKEQIKAHADIRKWDDKFVLLFTKDHLSGPAADYVVQLSQTTQINTSEELFNVLEKFFRPPSLPQALAEFANFRILPSENFTSVAHRLNVVTAKAYEDIKDQNTLNSIKFRKLLEILPTEVRAHILKSNITEYETAITQAQLYQDCSVSMTALNQISKVDTHEEIHALQQDINFIKSTLIQEKEDKKVKSQSPSKKDRQELFKKKFRTFPNKNKLYRQDKFSNSNKFQNFKKKTYHQQGNKDRLSYRRCQCCNSNYHPLRYCKKFKFLCRKAEDDKFSSTDSKKHKPQQVSSSAYTNFLQSQPTSTSMPCILPLPWFPLSMPQVLPQQHTVPATASSASSTSSSGLPHMLTFPADQENSTGGPCQQMHNALHHK